MSLIKRVTEVVSPSKAVEAPSPVPPEKVAPAAVEGEKIWELIKNINTKETIRFNDGSTYVFASSQLYTRDRKLAEKLLSVKDRYNIIEN